MATPGRALPQPTPETQHFWDGTKANELLLQRCDECSKVYFPPRPFCPACASRCRLGRAAGPSACRSVPSGRMAGSAAAAMQQTSMQ